MAMERREDSLLTSPDVTPFGRSQWRQSVMVIRRKMKSIQASDILYYAHPTGVKGKIQRVGCWRGQSLPRMRWKGRRAGLPTFPMHTCLLGLLSMLSNILLFMLSIWHRSPFGTKHALFLFPFLFLSVSRCFLFHVICFCRVIQVPPVTSWPTASSLVLSFSAISYSGDEPQRMTWQRIGEKKAQRIPAWKYSGRLSRLAHFSSCHS